MCTLAVYREVSPVYPLIVVANRDEFLGRASRSPEPWPEVRPVVAGRDLEAGGTWLGCRNDGSGRIVGLLNRRPDVDRAASGPGERSRGLLCLEALEAESIEAALGRLDAAEVSRYGGFNLFVADLQRAAVLDNGDGPRTTRLGPGLSVLTNLDVNDPRCPRLASATRRFEELRPLLENGATVEEAVPALAAVLASHEDGIEVVGVGGPGIDAAAAARFGPEAARSFARVCVHVGDYGTRSSSMIFVARDGAVRYLHAEGPPCTTDFAEIILS